MVKFNLHYNLQGKISEHSEFESLTDSFFRCKLKEKNMKLSVPIVRVSLCKFHCLKNNRIRSFCGPYFPAFGLNTERYGVSLRMQSKCGEIQTRKAPNKYTFHTVF